MKPIAAWENRRPNEVREGEVHVYRAAAGDAGDGLVRDVLARYLGVPAADLRFNRVCAVCGGPHGKPRLDVASHGADAPRFSVARSEQIFVMAVGRSDLGVDVEVRRHIEAADIARRMFSEEEAQRLARLSDMEAAAEFFRLWTRKEALGKALAAGLTEEVLRTDVLRPTDPWVLRDLDVAQDAAAALATDASVAVVRLFEL